MDDKLDLFEYFKDVARFTDDEAAKSTTSTKPTILLLTCMDSRYPHRITELMDRAGLRGKYDFFVLAGAALGANRVDNWRKTLFSHIETARKIGHLIERVIVMEHRDCGAYGPMGFDVVDWNDVKPGVEFAAHAKEAAALAKCLKRKFPKLVVDSLLLARDEDEVINSETHGFPPHLHRASTGSPPNAPAGAGAGGTT